MNSDLIERRLIHTRFQSQPWYIKLWRLRWRLVVPFEALWLFAKWALLRSPCALGHAWDMAVGLSDMRMRYWLTWREILARESRE